MQLSRHFRRVHNHVPKAGPFVRNRVVELTLLLQLRFQKFHVDGRLLRLNNTRARFIEPVHKIVEHVECVAALTLRALQLVGFASDLKIESLINSIKISLTKCKFTTNRFRNGIEALRHFLTLFCQNIRFVVVD